MHWIATVGLLLGAGCVYENEISGSWPIGGPGGCVLGHVVDVEARDGGQDFTREGFPCKSGGFSVGVPTSADHFWVAFEEVDPRTDALHATATIEVRMTGDFDLGVVYLQPIE